eukprot:5639040-Pyramimonas_sp.AAC.1
MISEAVVCGQQDVNLFREASCASLATCKTNQTGPFKELQGLQGGLHHNNTNNVICRPPPPAQDSGSTPVGAPTLHSHLQQHSSIHEKPRLGHSRLNAKHN